MASWDRKTRLQGCTGQKRGPSKCGAACHSDDSPRQKLPKKINMVWLVSFHVFRVELEYFLFENWKYFKHRIHVISWNTWKTMALKINTWILYGCLDFLPCSWKYQIHCQIPIETWFLSSLKKKSRLHCSHTQVCTSSCTNAFKLSMRYGKED